MIRLILSLPLILLSLAVGDQAAAQMSYGKAPRLPQNPQLPDGVGVEQKLGAQVPVDMVFFDHEGKDVTLKSCIGDKPTVLVLAYYSCPKLCTEVLNGLVGEMKKLSRIGLTAGRDYNVVTVGINPKENWTFARIKREAYLSEYDGRKPSEIGWWFLTASHGQGTDLVAAEQQIRTLADSIGFKYTADNLKQYEQAYAETDPQKHHVKLETAIRKTKDYVHPSAVIVLSPQGAVTQYFHGMPRLAGSDTLEGESPLELGYTAEDLRLALSDANGGKIGSLLKRVMVNCFAYDVEKGNYRIAMRSLALAAAPFPLLVLCIVWSAWRRAKKESVFTAATSKNAPSDSMSN